MYPLKSIIWFVGMTTSLPEASTCPLWHPKASKLYFRDFQTRCTPQMSFGLQTINFAGAYNLWILQRWLPFKNICTDSIHCSFYQGNPCWVAAQFFKHNQLISAWFQPRPGNMIPEINRLIKILQKHIQYKKGKIFSKWEHFLPSLRGPSTTSLAFLVIKNTSIITAIAVTMCCICRPVATNAFTIDPYLTFPHATHVQS